MFVTMNSVTIVAMAIVAIMTVCGIAVNLKAMVHNKNINSRVMFIIMAIFAISIIVLICNIDYSKSTPAEIYTEEDVTGAYNAGYDAAYEEVCATEDYFSNPDSNEDYSNEVYTKEDVTGAYNAGYDAGIEEASTTAEDWLSNLDSNKSYVNEVYTNEDLTGAYNAGYDAGVEEASTTAKN